MSWSPSRSAAIEPTIDASAPSARCVCPRMTPGCSSNVRFTRSSNSRIRSICVYIHTRSGTGAPLQGELCARGLVASVEDLGDRQAAELLGEDLDAPRAVVALVAAGGDVLADPELALAGQLAVVEDLVDRVVHVVVLTV